MGAPVWKGRLSYAGRSFAAKVLTGARSENVSFNNLHAKDGSRVKQVLFCAKEDKPIERADLVKGFEYSKDEFVVLTQTEVDGLVAAAPDIIELSRFVPLDQVDPVCFESSYYVVPGSVPGEDAEPPYAALFGALRRTSLAGIAVIGLYSRERPLLFRAGSTGIVAHALFYEHELRSLDQFRTREDAAALSDLAAASKALKNMACDFQPGDYPDLQQERTNALIEGKIRTKETAPAKPAKSAAAGKPARTARS
jgi:DNA end-binding protein Ku